jgi:hypothetical protein
MSGALIHQKIEMSSRTRLPQPFGSTFRALAHREVNIMSAQRFAVEFDWRVVGLAVRAAGGLRFFSSDPDFDELDGKLFPRARAMSSRLGEIAKLRGRPRLRGARAGRPALAFM